MGREGARDRLTLPLTASSPPDQHSEGSGLRKGGGEKKQKRRKHRGQKILHLTMFYA